MALNEEFSELEKGILIGEGRVPNVIGPYVNFLISEGVKVPDKIMDLKENFWSTCPSNGIEIESWYGEDLDDRELFKLIPFLRGLVENDEKEIDTFLNNLEKKS